MQQGTFAFTDKSSVDRAYSSKQVEVVGGKKKIHDFERRHHLTHHHLLVCLVLTTLGGVNYST